MQRIEQRGVVIASAILLSGLLATAGATQDFAGGATPVEAASVSGAVLDDGQAEMAKALRYHEALRRRPTPGFLFDRFVDAWVEASTLAELEQFLRQQSTQSSAINDQLLLAFYFAKQGNDIQALEQFRSALAADPSSAAGWYEKAVTEARTLNFEAALDDLTRAAEAGPEKELALRIAQLRGSLLVRSRQIDEAVQTWEALLQAHPDDEGLLEEIIEQQMGEGLYEQALLFCDRWIAATADPYQQVMRQLRKGDALQRAGKQAQALETYSETLRRVGRETWLEREIIAQIAEMFRREDNLAGLSDHMAQLIAAEPDRMALHKASARVLMELGNREEALAALKRLVELTPGERSHREAYLAALADAGEVDAALGQLRSLMGQYPDDAELSMRMAGLLHQSGQGDEAAAEIGAYVTKSGASEFAFLRAARTLDGFLRTADARATYEKCLAAHPDSSAARESFAVWLYGQGDKEPAITLWRELAARADSGELVRLARWLSAQRENQAAFDILHQRWDDCQHDGAYLGQLIDTASALNRFSEAVPWARQRVMKVRTSAELEAAVSQALRIFAKSDSPMNIQMQVAEDARRSVASACLLAELHELQGDRRQADDILAAAWSQVQTERADHPEQQGRERELIGNQQVRLLTSRQDWAGAATALRAMIDAPGGRKSTHIRRLVELSLRDNQVETALQWIAQWKQVSPGSTLPWIQESQALDQLGREEDSLRVLRQAARKFPADTDLALMLANRFTQLGQPREAERIFWRLYEASEQLSDRMRWIEQLAGLSIAAGRVDDLVKVLEERRRGNPESIEPLMALAQVHRVADNYEERRAALLEAARKQPDHVGLLFEVARMEEAAGDWEAALATYDRARPLDPTGRAAMAMAQVCLQYGEVQRGLAMLYELSGGDQADARQVELVADALVAAEEWKRARDYLTQQSQRIPDDYRLQYMLAVIEEELQDTEAAMARFLELLSAQGDLPGVRSAAVPSDPFQTAREEYLRLLPASVCQMMEVAESQSVAYSYREQQRRGMPYRYRSYQRSGAASIQLPDKDHVCRTWALCHLMTLTQELSAEDQTEWARLMRGRGVLEPEVSLRLGFNDWGMPDLDAETLREFPDNELILALVIMQSVGDVAPLPLEGEEAVARAEALFRESHPQFALIAAWQLALRDRASESQFGELIERTRQIEEPTEMLMSGIFYMLEEQDEPDGEDSAWRDAVNTVFMEWYPKLRTARQTWLREYFFDAIGKALARETSPDRLLEFLESEVRAHEEHVRGGGPRATGFPFGPMGMSSREQWLRPLSFPPNEWVHFPEHVASLPGRLMEDVPEIWLDDEELLPVPDLAWAEKFAPRVEQIEHPMLRAVMWMHIGLARERFGDSTHPDPYAGLQATLDAILTSGQPDLDALMLAAGLATHQEQWSAAAEYLERARHLPMQHEARQTIDRALVALAVHSLGLDRSLPEYEPVVASAKQAAIRLRRNRQSNAQRIELLAAMEQLELNEQAAEVELDLARSNSPRTPPGYSAPLSGFPLSGGGDRIGELIDAGKTDAALRLLIQQFNGLARETLAQTGNQQYVDYQWNEFKRLVRSLEMSDPLLAALTEEGSAAAKQPALTGLAHEVLGNPELAAPLYENALAANERQVAVRLRLIRLQMKTDPAAIERHLPLVNDRDLPLFLSECVQLIFDSAHSAEQKLSAVEGLLNQAEALPYSESNVGSLAQVVYRLGASWDPESTVAEERDWGSGFIDERDETPAPLPSLYVRPAEAGPAEADNQESKQTDESIAQRERFAALQAKRRDLHDRVCLTLIRSAEHGSDAFSRWLAAHEAAGDEVGPEAEELARAALLTAAAQRRNSRAPTLSYASGFLDEPSSPIGIPRRTPAEFLARHYAGQPEANRLRAVTELTADLRARRLNSEADHLEALAQLYSLPEPELVAQATAMLTAPVRRGAEPSVSLPQVFQLWEDRQLQIDAAPIILSVIAKIAEQPDSSHRVALGATAAYLAEWAEQGRDQEARQLVHEISAILIGPLETQRARKKELATATRRAGREQQAEQMRWDFSREFFVALARNQHTCFIGFEHLINAGMYDVLQDWWAPRAISQVFESTKDDPDRALSWLERSPFLGPIGQFDPWVMNEAHTETLWGRSIRNLSWDWSNHASALRERLESRDEQGFGARVLVLLMHNQLTTAALYELIADEMEAFQQLDESSQRALAAFVDEMSALPSNRGRASSISERGQQVQALLLTARGRATVGVMEAKTLADLGVTMETFKRWVGPALNSVIREDRERFLSAFKQIAQLARDELKRSSRSGSYYGGYGEQHLGVEEVMWIAVAGESTVWNAIPCLLEALPLVEKPSISLVGSINSYTHNTLQAKWKELAPSGAAEDAARRLALLVEQLAADLGDLDATPLIPGYSRFLQSLDAETLDAVEDWVRGVLAGEEPTASHRDWAIAIGLARASRQGDVLRAATASPQQTQWLALIADPQKPLLYRWAIAEVVLTDRSLPVESLGPILDVQGLMLQNPGLETTSWLLRTLEQVLQIQDWNPIRESLASLAAQWERILARQQGDYLDAGELKTAIELFHRLDQPASIQQLTRHHARSLLDPAALTKLVEYGYTTQAAHVLVNQGRDGSQFLTGSARANRWSINPSQPAVVFTANIEAQLPDMLRRVTNEGQRFLSEIYLASLPDATDPSQQPLVDHEARMTALGQRFNDIPFSNRGLRETALMMLAAHPSSAQQIGPALSEAAGRLRAIDLWSRDANDQRETQCQQMVAAHVVVSLLNGDVSALRRANELLTATPEDLADSNLAYELGEALSVVRRDLANYLLRVGNRIPRDVLAEALPELRALAAHRARDSGYYSSDSFGTVLVFIHALCRQTDEFKAWKQSLSESQRSQLGSGDLDQFWSQLRASYPAAQRDPIADRFEVVRSLWEFGSETGASIGTGHFREGIKESCEGCKNGRFGLDAIKDSGLLSGEELAEYGSQLAEINPVGGEIWRQVGYEQVAAGQLEAAAESFRKAVETDPQVLAQARHNRMVEYAWVLNQLGRKDEARNVIKEIGDTLLFGDNVARYTELKSEEPHDDR